MGALKYSPVQVTQMTRNAVSDRVLSVPDVSSVSFFLALALAFMSQVT